MVNVNPMSATLHDHSIQFGVDIFIHDLRYAIHCNSIRVISSLNNENSCNLSLRSYQYAAIPEDSRDKIRKANSDT